MPAPAVYAIGVAGVIATVAAGFAFRHYVYEPHLAPKFEAWAQEFLAKREQARRRRGSPIPVYASSVGRSEAESVSQPPLGTSVELDNLTAREVAEWRSQVDRSRSDGTLRQRRTVNQSSSLSFVPMQETHVLFDPSTSSTPSLNRSPPVELAQPILPTAFRLPTPITSPARSSHTLSSPSISAAEMRSPSIHAASPLPSPPPQLPRSETSLSDLDLLSVHSLDDVLSTSSWASANPSDR